MSWKKEKLELMLQQVEAIINRSLKAKMAYSQMLVKIHPNFLTSARNLIYYRALRSTDLRNLQKQLGWMGLSRLAKAESHVLTSLYTTRSILSSLLQDEPMYLQRAGLSIRDGNRLLKANAKALLGTEAEGRNTRIMVTLPSEAAVNYQLVEKMVEAGMNCARINCAHDEPEEWLRMIQHVRQASNQLGKPCKVAMDLGGPKIRTGPLIPGPKVRRYRPAKDKRGKILRPLEIWLGPTPLQGQPLPHLPISEKALGLLKKGSKIYFKDARHKKRKITILQLTGEGAIGSLPRTAYLETGMHLYLDKKGRSDSIVVGELPAMEAPILLNTGDELVVHSAARLGEPAQYNEDGKLTAPAHIGCTASEILAILNIGDPILFDDGAIAGEIVYSKEEQVTVKITHTREGGGKLRADKGINLPSSQLTIRGLTEKDKEDLPFVVQHADLVNLSFVNTARDIQDLIEELEALNALDKIGIILKIETKQGFDNLVDILLTAMQAYPVGVMIARGDLAIESGWEKIGRVQEEILSLCRAAHLPDIWATQVLENLAKRGIPSRAEITDAVMAQRADCVMLNKGGYILQAIGLLDTILKDMDNYQDKNAPMLPAMRKASE
jgi:pyruvate kinase